MGNIQTGKISGSSATGKKGAFHLSKQPVVHGRPDENVHKYEATLDELPSGQPEVPAFEDLGPLPSSYGSKSLFLVARDPQWLFCYWDVDWGEYPPERMTDGKVFLKVFETAQGGEVYRAEVTPEARNWYVSAGHGNATFVAELGFVNRSGAWEAITRSNEATTPSDGLSDQVADTFATVPYHLAFQKMLDLVAPARRPGESLLDALARIQAEGRTLAFALGQIPQWTDEQRRVLAVLLGNNLDELRSMSPEQIDLRLRQQLKERLSSEGSSGLLAGELGPGGAASLFSGMGLSLSSWLASWQQAVQVGELSSWLSSWLGGAEIGAFASWLASWPGAAESQAISSWLASWPGVGAPSSALSSWLASWPLGAIGQNEALSSWLASWPGAAQSSFWSSWLSSWAQAAGGSEVFQSSWFSSWQTAAKGQAFWSSWLSSWAGAAGGLSSVSSSFLSSWLSSWAGAGGLSSVSSFFQSSWLSSWGGVAAKRGESKFWSSWLSSWGFGLGGASGAFSSGGLSSFGASWSAQPFGKPRGFFMHVNAEVIFYGGTHPDAKVWIDGKPVELTPEGTFRYHFVFPDGKSEIPIVAQSPDGREQRCAMLRFERGTVRIGEVGHTPQPAHLGAPMGMQ